jgi:hypothetical protein
MDSPSRKQLESFELLNFSRGKLSHKSSDSPVVQRPAKLTNQHSSSAFIEGQSTSKSVNKLSFDIDDIRKEIKERESRMVEREKEIEEFCQSDSRDDEKEMPYMKAAIETTITVPCSPRKEDENKEAGYRVWICCCKKICSVM